MKVRVLSDANWESKLDHATRVLSLDGKFDHFGVGVEELVLVLSCRESNLGHKQRVRYVRESAKLYIDVMLELEYFVNATHKERRAKIAEEVLAQLKAVFEQRRIKDFSSTAFLARLDAILQSQMNGEASTQFDHLCLERAAL